jgi:hypothetical protein
MRRRVIVPAFLYAIASQSRGDRAAIGARRSQPVGPDTPPRYNTIVIAWVPLAAGTRGLIRISLFI